MNRAWAGAAAVTVLLGGCELNRTVIGVEAEPAPPREVGAYYYAGAVTVTWELAPDWDGEVFRVYGKRSTDGDYYLVAEVTSCAGGACAYTDTNIQAGRIYHYYVAAVDTRSRLEAASSSAVEVAVPHQLPPPVPADLGVVALDHTNYLSWASDARSEADFSHYRVYLRAADGASYLLGESVGRDRLGGVPRPARPERASLHVLRDRAGRAGTRERGERAGRGHAATRLPG